MKKVKTRDMKYLSKFTKQIILRKKGYMDKEDKT